MQESNAALAQRSRVLVTGASGFVGRALVERLVADRRHSVRAAVRTPMTDLPAAVEQVRIAGIDATTEWRAALAGVEFVVHAAARVHVMRERHHDPLGAFREVNVAGTLRLAQEAAAAGVRRLVFLSSIKVNGESTAPGHPFREDDAPAPRDPYGISKREAEDGLLALARTTAMQVVIVRPPLVYGPGVRANFASLMRLVRSGMPLPLGAIDNRRTFVALDNLVDLIVTCIDHPAAANEIFLAGDAEDLSTTDLLRRLGAALGRPARLVPIPARWIESAAALIGRRAIADRLCGSLQLDIDKAARVLGWKPPCDVDAALRATAARFLASSGR
ncbi:MAG TPA: SDR family oxidoreductase [Burkholderiaceae bacterium]|nr:SDR family oxidoreductase [Burkholderiaceae bacterium]